MRAQLLRVLVPIAGAALLAWPLGYFVWAWLGWALFSLALIAQLLFQLRNFSRLERWSRNPVLDASLEGEGDWDNVFGRLYRHEKEMRGVIARRDAEISMLIAAAQALTDGVVLLDRNDSILFCNHTAEDQLGLRIASDRGQAVVNLVRQPEFAAYLENRDFSKPLTLRSERIKDLVLSIYVIPYAENNRLMQVKDVTQSERLDRMRRDFVANVSHELRTPLTVLGGFIETLQEIELDPEAQGHYLQLMGEQSKRMLTIVQDLLTLSSIEASPPPAYESIDMASLLDKLQRDAQALSSGRHQIVLDSDGCGDLRGAEGELVGAFANLVANAVRYTPEGGTVRISWRADASGGEFAVEDSGIGIEPQHIPRLTERFYRVDRGRSRDVGGTGLGLAIVKHALSRHQARLEIRSQLGQGSRFAAVFPPSRICGV